jgi:vanillate/4-hydroxybenzoate decarboxylase subunit D
MPAMPLLLAHQRTDRAAYPDEFKMTIEDIINAPEVPAIPPLLAKPGS